MKRNLKPLKNFAWERLSSANIKEIKGGAKKPTSGKGIHGLCHQCDHLLNLMR